MIASRHCFNDIGDSDGDLVSLRGLPVECDIDSARRTVRVSGWALYGDLGEWLHRAGWALPNLASLPHISVAGAIGTGTHGSGDRLGSLATAVVALEYLDAHGAARTVTRADPDFAGHVVGLGALGVVTHVHLAVEPTYDVAQTVWTDLPWAAVLDDLEVVTSAATSVSLFTDYTGDTVGQVWLKSRADSGSARSELLGARLATSVQHMLAGGDLRAVTDQGGEPGPWHRRLAHFRLDFTPSAGAELQSEYLVPRSQALVAIERMRALAPSMAPLLQVAEIRTIAADDLWLSGAHDTDVVAFHCTWLREQSRVEAVLEEIEAALLPLGARPHWGKLFRADAATLAAAYPRMGDFCALRDRLDPERVFDNAFLRRVLGP